MKIDNYFKATRKIGEEYIVCFNSSDAADTENAWRRVSDFVAVSSSPASLSVWEHVRRIGPWSTISVLKRG